MLTYNVLKTVKLLEIDNKFIKLGYTTKYNEVAHFKKEKNVEYLKNAVEKVTGMRLEIVFEAIDKKMEEELLKNLKEK